MSTLTPQAELSELVDSVVKENGSDIHLSEGRQPVLRVSSFLIPLVKKPMYSREDVEGILKIMLTPDNEKILETKKEVDFAYTHNSKYRFRGNAYNHLGKLAVALRLIPQETRSFAELNLPPVLEMFAEKKQGFFLVVGPTGQGKSTTLATMIEMINTKRLERIITIEDPIEYIFTPKKSIIDQREVRVDTPSFATALNGTFRQDVDVIMIGEMREPETIATAVTAAETGHLVYSTLHTNDAAQSVDRIIDSFPPEQQNQIRLQLASSLVGILSQRLVPRVSGGLIPVCELLINTNAVANLIRENRTHEIPMMIETGMQEGMIDLNRSLVDLVRAGEITVEEAFSHSSNPKTLERML
ncbi:MAG TPA: PilT/PilU family type 4a pilus ATPase [Candidatus Paceibacterota bacterium]|nr:PilT/PilU family type 4a pilus ATPase [Candidatus Paceibacterota bacterium]